MIKLTKIDINPNNQEVVHAASVDEYRQDQERGTWGQFFEGKSPPVEYWVAGHLIRPVAIGEHVLIERLNRNGLAKWGIMKTSTVQKIEQDGDVTFITTANSLYKMENYDEEISAMAEELFNTLS